MRTQTDEGLHLRGYALQTPRGLLEGGAVAIIVRLSKGKEKSEKSPLLVHRRHRRMYIEEVERLHTVCAPADNASSSHILDYIGSAAPAVVVAACSSEESISPRSHSQVHATVPSVQRALPRHQNLIWSTCKTVRWRISSRSCAHRHLDLKESESYGIYMHHQPKAMHEIRYLSLEPGKLTKTLSRAV